MSARFSSDIDSLIDQKHANQIIKLLTFLRNAPRDIQDVLIPYAIFIGAMFVDKYPQIEPILKDVNRVCRPSSTVPDGKYQRTLIKLAKVFQINDIISMKLKGDSHFPSLLQFYTNYFVTEQTTPDLTSLKEQNAVHPQYNLKQLIAKKEGQHSIGNRFLNHKKKIINYSYKDKNKEPFLYSEPRFIDKLAELVHIRSNGEHKGEIVLLEYIGNFITGNRVWVVGKDSYVDVWQKISEKYPYPFQQYLPELQKIHPQQIQ